MIVQWPLIFSGKAILISNEVNSTIACNIKPYSGRVIKQCDMYFNFQGYRPPIYVPKLSSKVHTYKMWLTFFRHSYIKYSKIIAWYIHQQLFSVWGAFGKIIGNIWKSSL